MLDLEFRKRAVCDIRSIQIHYEINEGETVAKRHISDILSGVEALREFPDMGHPVENPAASAAGYRKYLKSQFWIYYSHNIEKLTIWRVVSTKQDIDDYMFTEF